MHNILDQYFDVVIGIYILTLFFLQKQRTDVFLRADIYPKCKGIFLIQAK